MRRNSASGTSGNVFFLILISISLFATLMFTFSRGVQLGGERVSSRKAELVATDVMAQAQKIERAIQYLLSRDISENDISFEHSSDVTYVNPNCSTSSCLVFHINGGGISWADAPVGANQAGGTYFFAPNRVGTQDGTTEQIGTSSRDLTILLRVTPQICSIINEKNGNITSNWAAAGTPPNISTPFTGNFADGGASMIARANFTGQQRTGCFCIGTAPCDSSEPHYFYSVLIER